MPIPNVNRNTLSVDTPPSTTSVGTVGTGTHPRTRRLPVKHFLIAISMNAAI